MSGACASASMMTKSVIPSMGKRGVVADYAGEPLYRGDLVNYASRQGNGVRASDAIVRHTYFARLKGRKYPMLIVQPTGTDSYSEKPRKTLRAEHVAATHVRLLRSNVTGEQNEDH
ncbi:hypothetical protein ACFYOA_08110 [Streptomyces iakyrus]|uniref:hypothetical protein n=1 Tax=Streptomyces iakyrus TaxID=68219 RepID=UPI0036826D79